jgi:hypothetical protein
MALPVTKVTLPSDLVSAANGRLGNDLLATVGFPGQGPARLHRATAIAWSAFADACLRATGVTLTITSVADAYRSYDQQKSAFLTRMEPVSYITYLATPASRRRKWSYNGKTYWRLKPGYAPVASPGTSNHGWGLALDVCELRSNGTVLGISASTAWPWILANAARFNFSWEVQSEPWHLRNHGGDTSPPTPTPTLPPFDPTKAQWGLWPLSATKPTLRPATPTMKGDAVRYLQGVIFYRAGGNIKIDGDYGPFTQARVADMQRWFGVTVDSVVGPVTWKIVDDLSG